MNLLHRRMLALGTTALLATPIVRAQAAGKPRVAVAVLGVEGLAVGH